MRTVSLTQVVILLGRVEELIFARSCHVRSRVDRRGLGQRRPRLDPSAPRAWVWLGLGLGVGVGVGVGIG